MFAAYVSKNPTFTGSELDYYKMVAEAAESIVIENEELKQKNYELISKSTVILNENEAYAEEVSKLELEIKELKKESLELRNQINILEKKIIFEKEHVVDSLKDTNIEPVIKNSIFLINKMVSEKMNQIEEQVCTKFENLKLGRSSTVNKPKVQEHCVEWWCPVHSTFEEIVKTIKPETEDDIKIIRRAKARNAYWKKGGQIRCCTNDRLKTNTTLYVLPSCWPKENAELVEQNAYKRQLSVDSTSSIMKPTTKKFTNSDLFDVSD
ncbi:uncharacterized protein LOC115034981 [Acyrthosiphon pisum]|uniref:Uncharacterized protein n=1 Tax=Acyrthosiphon pisum TaxID=7029 RepID=A0A8R2JX53_ACYPI|nr:uncharacterized protein LOC115034981 [Acyrthosiphon pisum]